MAFKQFLLIIVTLTLASIVSCADKRPSNVSPDVWSEAKAGRHPNVMVEVYQTSRTTERLLEEMRVVVATTDTRSSENTKGSRLLTELLTGLQDEATQLLAPLTDILEVMGVPFTVLWSANLLYIPDITIPIILDIAGKSIVKWIRLEEVVPAPIPPGRNPSPRPPPVGNTTWNIGLIDARCPDIPTNGTGVIVGIMDTGVLWDHVELKENFVGAPYGWWDGYEPVVSPYPLDHGGHGTHVAGTIVGRTVGVAPGAKWMACRMGDGDFPESAILKCGQYMCAPWRYDDATEKGNVDVRPYVINNSWGGPGGSQFLDPESSSYYSMIALWTALGITHAFAMGNNGPACGSGGYPGNFDIALAVGAVDKTTTLAWFSSRGPTVMAKDFQDNSTAKGSCIIPSPPNKCISTSIQGKQLVTLNKPDISGPGVDITSAWYTGVRDYNTISGTSMATPHIAGIITLMISANPGPHWTQMLAYEILTETADTSLLDLKGEGDFSKSPKSYPYVKSSHVLCDCIGAGICDWYPNNLYGYGLAIACDAVKLALTRTEVTKTNAKCNLLSDLKALPLTDKSTQGN